MRALQGILNEHFIVDGKDFLIIMLAYPIFRVSLYAHVPIKLSNSIALLECALFHKCTMQRSPYVAENK